MKHCRFPAAISPRKTVAKRVLPRIETPDRPPRSRHRKFIIAALLLVLLGTALLVGRAVIRTNYYVTAYGGTSPQVARRLLAAYATLEAAAGPARRAGLAARREELTRLIAAGGPAPQALRADPLGLG